jgi:outer membrane murein-binding lipoprotein Lpp
MMKSAILILVILLGSSGLAFADPVTVPYSLEAAKIVSGGGYFWLEVTSNWGPSGGRSMGSDIFVRFPSDFSLHAVCINNQEVTVTVLAVNDTLQIAVYLEPLDKVEVLLSAPYLAENETVRHAVINVGIISPLGGTVFTSTFHMSVVGLAFLPNPDALETAYQQLLTENANMNKTADDLQSQVNDLNDQIANLAADNDALNETVINLNTEVANLNSRLINESYAIIVVASAAALAIVTAAYLAVRRRRPTQIAGQSSTPNR